MELESRNPNPGNRPLVGVFSFSALFLFCEMACMNFPQKLVLAYQSLGVVYGDLSTSPLYVFTKIFEGKEDGINEDTIFGAFSLIFWTLTLIPLLKYVFVVLSADDNGEGGAIALYSLLCRHANSNLIPNQQTSDEALSTYKYHPSSNAANTTTPRKFLEKHKRLKTVLLLIVLFGACMVIGDGVLTPAISVLSSMSALQMAGKGFSHDILILLSCVILIGLFAFQHSGTHRVAFVFAPIVIIWLVSIFSIGLYNAIHWNSRVILAFSPHYIVRFFNQMGRKGIISLGGVLLCITGTEAMYGNLGHFTAWPIRIAFTFVVYPCLVVQYMGQAAFLSKNLDARSSVFYNSIPKSLFWSMFVVATLTTIVGSQAIISATFSIIKQCHALGCFPRVKVVHTSKQIYGQIYIPEINWILMVLTLAVTIGFQDTSSIGNAYGLAFLAVLFVTTFLMALVIIFVWQKSVFLGIAFLLFFWFIEGIYFSVAIIKVPQGGWVSLALAFIFMIVMFLWHYGTHKKCSYDLNNSVSLQWLLGLGPGLGIVRVPGMGLIYSELATGVPAVFSHFVTNLPAFHKVVVFICIKSVPVPYVPPDERFLINRVCPRSYRMYRCVIRYGYKDVQSDDGDFENQLIRSIAEFINRELLEPELTNPGCTRRTFESKSSLIVSEQEDMSLTGSTQNSKSFSIGDSQSVDEDRSPQIRRRQVKLQLFETPDMDPAVREELMDLIDAKEAGVAYILGHWNVQTRRSSPFLKRLAIYIYAFLRKNCRGPSVALSIPHISLVEVGMTCYV